MIIDLPTYTALEKEVIQQGWTFFKENLPSFRFSSEFSFNLIQNFE